MQKSETPDSKTKGEMPKSAATPIDWIDSATATATATAHARTSKTRAKGNSNHNEATTGHVQQA